MTLFFQKPLFLLCFSILLISIPADAEEYGNTEFFLAKSGIGDIYDLSIDEPSEATPKYWKCRDDPNQANTFYPLVSWEMNMGGPLEIGDSYSYIFWVESTNVQEITFKTTLYIRTQEGYNNLSVDEVSEVSGFGSFLSENYTLEFESSGLDKSIFPEIGDVIAIRHMMFLSLSYDHRVVDGALGGQFVRRVADYLENFDKNTIV